MLAAGNSAYGSPESSAGADFDQGIGKDDAGAQMIPAEMLTLQLASNAACVLIGLTRLRLSCGAQPGRRNDVHAIAISLGAQPQRLVRAASSNRPLGRIETLRTCDIP